MLSEAAKAYTRMAQARGPTLTTFYDEDDRAVSLHNMAGAIDQFYAYVCKYSGSSRPQGSELNTTILSIATQFGTLPDEHVLSEVQAHSFRALVQVCFEEISAHDAYLLHSYDISTPTPVDIVAAEAFISAFRAGENSQSRFPRHSEEEDKYSHPILAYARDECSPAVAESVRFLTP